MLFFGMFLADAGQLISSQKVLETTREASMFCFLLLFQRVGHNVVSASFDHDCHENSFKLIVEIGSHMLTKTLGSIDEDSVSWFEFRT